VHLVEILDLRVVRFQIVITERPPGLDAPVVAQFAEVLFAETEQSSTVKLGVAAHIVVRVGVQILAVLIEPGSLAASNVYGMQSGSQLALPPYNLQ
jgi:hypothetical protein